MQKQSQFNFFGKKKNLFPLWRPVTCAKYLVPGILMVGLMHFMTPEKSATDLFNSSAVANIDSTSNTSINDFRVANHIRYLLNAGYTDTSNLKMMAKEINNLDLEVIDKKAYFMEGDKKIEVDLASEVASLKGFSQAEASRIENNLPTSYLTDRKIDGGNMTMEVRKYASGSHSHTGEKTTLGMIQDMLILPRDDSHQSKHLKTYYGYMYNKELVFDKDKLTGYIVNGDNPIFFSLGKKKSSVTLKGLLPPEVNSYKKEFPNYSYESEIVGTRINLTMSVKR